ncbi:MAG: bacillithiol biosynthesis cysteine-adding enzyme BshC [Flavobacteriales bacterium]|nr:bacillithiol biosynthesis cysteine-adding enzyme BshC [Flavobacteriales bacterium]
MPVNHIRYADTQRFSPLVLDYLSKEKALDELYNFPPTLAGLLTAARDRKFPAINREVLCEVLRKQYAGIPIHEKVSESLIALAQDDCLTLTTGHQLCLFTGPLYVPFKILNSVRLAKKLSDERGKPVIPVFWMATEDHDRPEIDHAWINGVKVQWPGEISGAVGPLPLTGIDAVVDECIQLIGQGPHAAEIAALLRSSYRPEYTLAQATRLFVNGLFGHLGVVCLDADDRDLKRLFIPAMQEELLNQVAQRAVSYANEKLAKNYGAQAHAREINLFYLRTGDRSRIERQGDRYQVLNNGPSFSLDELLNELEQHPERFSPNVVLRPIYQETILPNVAYVGGGGELAYWFQLKWVFQALQVPMPALFLRTSAAFISEKHVRQWKELGLDVADLFKPQEELREVVAKSLGDLDTDLDPERELLNAFYNDLLKRAEAADSTLKGAVEARRASALFGLDRIGKGLVRAAKQNQAIPLDRLARIQEAVFPGGGLQERRDNILPLLAMHGMGYIDVLLMQLDPLVHQFAVIEE